MKIKIEGYGDAKSELVVINQAEARIQMLEYCFSDENDENRSLSVK